MPKTPPENSKLLVISFDDGLRAQEFLLAVARLQHNDEIQLHDAVLIARDADGKSHVRETTDVTPGRPASAPASGGCCSARCSAARSAAWSSARHPRAAARCTPSSSTPASRTRPIEQLRNDRAARTHRGRPARQSRLGRRPAARADPLPARRTRRDRPAATPRSRRCRTRSKRPTASRSPARALHRFGLPSDDRPSRSRRQRAAEQQRRSTRTAGRSAEDEQVALGPVSAAPGRDHQQPQGNGAIAPRHACRARRAAQPRQHDVAGDRGDDATRHDHRADVERHEEQQFEERRERRRRADEHERRPSRPRPVRRPRPAHVATPANRSVSRPSASRSPPARPAPAGSTRPPAPPGRCCSTARRTARRRRSACVRAHRGVLLRGERRSVDRGGDLVVGVAHRQVVGDSTPSKNVSSPAARSASMPCCSTDFGIAVQ